MRSRRRALLVPWPIALVASMACNVITGADGLKVGEEGAAGEGAGGEGASGGDAGEGTGGSGNDSGTGGRGESCGQSLLSCRTCCATRAGTAFLAAARQYFDSCLCEPARSSSGSGNGECNAAVPGCVQCCGALCQNEDVLPTPEQVALCTQCGMQQGGEDLCRSPREYCEETQGDEVCASYFDCEDEDCSPR
jgi:hypothetical protein